MKRVWIIGSSSGSQKGLSSTGGDSKVVRGSIALLQVSKLLPALLGMVRSADEQVGSFFAFVSLRDSK